MSHTLLRKGWNEKKITSCNEMGLDNAYSDNILLPIASIQSFNRTHFDKWIQNLSEELVRTNSFFTSISMPHYPI